MPAGATEPVLSFDGKRVLVTGGSGFIGSHFVERLLELGARVRIPIHNRLPHLSDERIETVPADLTQLEACQRVSAGVDRVIHAAGGVGAAGITSAEAQLASLTLNLTLSANMLLAANQQGVERFLLFSSSTGYPPFEHPVEETNFWDGDPHPAYFGYGWMRRYLERLGEQVQRTTPMQVAIVRPSAVYGERDNFAPEGSHVVAALIRRAAEGENPFVVWGGPEVVRDFLYVRDLVEGSLLALEQHAKADAINIGYGQRVTVGELAELILAATEHPVQPIYDRSRPTTLPFRAVDISKARHLLGFEPQVGLSEGLARTVAWYRSQC